MSEHIHDDYDTAGVREMRRRAGLARDIVDQHTSGVRNRAAHILDLAREQPAIALGIAALIGLVLGRAIRR